MRRVALLQARMNSTRLPGKVLLPLAEKPMVLHIVERMRACPLIDHVVVATATDPSNDPLEAVCRQHGVDVFRGSLDDVLGRMAAAGRAAGADIVTRVTCDCPLVETGYVEQRLKLVAAEGLDFTYCLSSSLLFAGASVMSMAFLERLASEVTDPRDREHCGLPYALRNRDRFRSREVFPDPELNAWNFRLTVDEAADYELMCRIYETLYRPSRPIPIREVVALLRGRPEWAAINRHVVQNPIQPQPSHAIASPDEENRTL